jgi:ketosteroid isomerase-like protein
MLLHRLTVMLYVVLGCLLMSGVSRFSTVNVPSRDSKSDQTIWDLEQAYWRYVQENNLSAYQGLWHKDFLGWPTMSSAPVRKDHITDWITSQTSKGLAFKLVEFKPAAIQLTGDVGVVCYWAKYKWVEKDGSGMERTLRVTHSWVKTADSWAIIGGMSMAEAANPSN